MKFLYSEKEDDKIQKSFMDKIDYFLRPKAVKENLYAIFKDVKPNTLEIKQKKEELNEFIYCVYGVGMVNEIFLILNF